MLPTTAGPLELMHTYRSAMRVTLLGFMPILISTNYTRVLGTLWSSPPPHTHTPTHTRAHVRVRTHARAHTRARAHTHTHTQSSWIRHCLDWQVVTDISEELAVIIYQSTRSHIPDNSDLHQQWCGNLKSHILSADRIKHGTTLVVNLKGNIYTRPIQLSMWCGQFWESLIFMYALWNWILRTKGMTKYRYNLLYE
jgi:hypothetical protein